MFVPVVVGMSDYSLCQHPQPDTVVPKVEIELSVLSMMRQYRSLCVCMCLSMPYACNSIIFSPINTVQLHLLYTQRVKPFSFKW